MKRVYVITLYSGENEIELCKSSVRQQQDVSLTHEVICFLPKKEAHQKLFQKFEERKHEFDFLAKLDADMVFSSPTALSAILALFSSNTDVLSITVWDRITNSAIPSFNVFSNRCSFDYKNNDALFTDKLPIKYPGIHTVLVDSNRYVLHSPEPTPYQAYMFGVHRALKVMQYGNPVPRIEATYYQLRYIMSAYNHYLDTGDTASCMASLGAAQVLRGEIQDSTLTDKRAYEESFSKAQHTEHFYPLNAMVGKSFTHQLLRIWGVKRAALGVTAYGRRKIFGLKK